MGSDVGGVGGWGGAGTEREAHARHQRQQPPPAARGSRPPPKKTHIPTLKFPVVVVKVGGLGLSFRKRVQRECGSA
eukprot:2450474-Rhodomonas_salina.2